jgi:hypothetical protein
MREVIKKTIFFLELFRMFKKIKEVVNYNLVIIQMKLNTVIINSCDKNAFNENRRK